LASGLNQSELAGKLGVSQSAVSTWENETSKPDKKILAKLESILGPLMPNRANEKLDLGPIQIDVFGVWLSKARAKVGMSKAELAQASGLSLPTIYNIETGRSTNPQEETRRRLERALKTEVPKEVQEEAAEEQEITGLGTLKDFDPYGSDIPKVAGVYVFYDVSDRPVYVGKGDNISIRVKDHEEKFWFKRPIVDYASYIEITGANLRHQVEQVLIKFLKSNAVINKQSVER
jgi:transcriptional regulator with XRE-family HTH domain